MKMSRRNKGSVEDMIHAFRNKIDELEDNNVNSATEMYDEDDPVDMGNEDEVRDAVAMYLSTMNIDPMKFEDVVDNYVDLIMDHGYDSIQEWWDEFNDSEEMEQLRSMGYISDDIDECDRSVNDEYDIVTI